MELHTLKPFHGSRKKAKRVGRGHGSAHGTYSTRGMKGQRARSGGSKGLKLKGMKQLLLRIPKLGGFKSIHEKDTVVNLDILQRVYENGETVTPVTLIKKHVITVPKKGMPTVKILGTGLLTKKLIIAKCRISAAAKEKIEAAGGSVSLEKEKKS
ncbi:50S ribosomal protein L15 [Candidatus Uhrbacteria bacterium]|nr:50S ribosomal protein L15 [Candidatus Uhrbacteria bacterium]